MNKKNNGFTLIELLAVVTILGILLLIAIPGVNRLISNSRKNTYVTVAKEYIKSAKNLITSGEYEMDNASFTYYIPAVCLPIESRQQSPYGDFKEAYVGVTYENGTYNYFWTSRDTSNRGIELTFEDGLKRSKVIESIEKIETNIGIDGRDKIVAVDADTCLLDTSNVIDASQFVKKDGEKIELPEGFENDSWDTIYYAVRSGNTDKYKVGETKKVHLEGYGDYHVRIVNKSFPDVCRTEGFSQTACGFVLMFEEVVAGFPAKMHSTDTNVGGWPNTDLYKILNGEVYNAFPNDLKSIIINTYVVSGHGPTKGETANFVSSDKLYILTRKEIWGDNSYDTASTLTRQLDYYSSIDAANHNELVAKTNLKGVARWWWLRSSRSNFAGSFNVVTKTGGKDQYGSTSENVADGLTVPVFRIG